MRVRGRDLDAAINPINCGWSIEEDSYVEAQRLAQWSDKQTNYHKHLELSVKHYIKQSYTKDQIVDVMSRNINKYKKGVLGQNNTNTPEYNLLIKNVSRIYDEVMASMRV